MEINAFKQSDVTEVTENDSLLFKENIENVMKELNDRGFGAITYPHVGIMKDAFAMYGVPSADSVGIICNPKYVITSKKTNTIETFMSDGKNYMCERGKEITAIFQSFDVSGRLVKITKNLRGEKAIMFQHFVDYLHGDLVGRPLDE